MSSASCFPKTSGRALGHSSARARHGRQLMERYGATVTWPDAPARCALLERPADVAHELADALGWDLRVSAVLCSS